MDDGAHHPGRLHGPAHDLYAAAESVTAAWLEAVVGRAIDAARFDLADHRVEVDDALGVTVARLLHDLRALLAQDVDEQRTTPLALYRTAVAEPNALLRRIGVPPPARQPFDVEAFPDDTFALGPASWADIHPSMHEPGITWGAWKAMTVLRRRRADGDAPSSSPDLHQ